MPSMYRCQYHPCPYESKRESNCKQHMEKAHNWVYVRSKNNGKHGKRSQNLKTPPTPSMTTPGSEIFHAPTPDFSEAVPNYAPYSSHSRNQSLESSVVASESSVSFVDMPPLAFEDTFGPVGSNFNWNDSTTEYTSGGPSDYTNNSHRPSWDSAMANPSSMPSSFEASFTPYDDQPLVGDSFDWSNLPNTMNNDFTSFNIQLITPATSVENRPLDAFSRHPSISVDATSRGQIPSFSPGAQGDAMLYSPYSNNADDASVDEGYGDFTNDVQRPAHDFPLFDNSRSASGLNSTATGSLFPELPGSGFVPSAWSGRGTDLAHQFGMGDLMMDEE